MIIVASPLIGGLIGFILGCIPALICSGMYPQYREGCGALGMGTSILGAVVGFLVAPLALGISHYLRLPKDKPKSRQGLLGLSLLMVAIVWGFSARQHYNRLAMEGSIESPRCKNVSIGIKSVRVEGDSLKVVFYNDGSTPVDGIFYQSNYSPFYGKLNPNKDSELTIWGYERLYGYSSRNKKEGTLLFVPRIDNIQCKNKAAQFSYPGGLGESRTSVPAPKNASRDSLPKNYLR